MKLIAGSVLAGFGLLTITLGHLFASVGRDFVHGLGTPIATLAILFMVGGLLIIGWAIWEAIKKGKT